MAGFAHNDIFWEFQPGLPPICIFRASGVVSGLAVIRPLLRRHTLKDDDRGFKIGPT